jgi:hypothetical protein
MKLLFFTLYRWAKRYNFWGTPHLSAMYFLSLFIFMNCLTVYGIYSKLVLGSSSTIPQVNKVLYILCLGIIVFIVYLLYLRNNRYIEVLEKFESEDDLIMKGNIVTLLYITLSIAILFALAFYRNK